MSAQHEIKKGVLRIFESRVRYAVSAVLMVGAGYVGWVAPSETDVGRQCFDLESQTRVMTTNLYEKGTLGRDSCLLCPIEIRNPSDFDALQKYGDLKNERDRVCRLNNGDYWQPKAEVSRYLAALGLIGLILPRRSSKNKK